MINRGQDALDELIQEAKKLDIESICLVTDIIRNIVKLRDGGADGDKYSTDTISQWENPGMHN